jgi:hypothetical protein
MTLLSGFGTAGNWTFEFRAEDTDQISTFQRYCTDHGIGATLPRLKSLAEIGVSDEYNLTADAEITFSYAGCTVTVAGTDALLVSEDSSPSGD